MTARSPLQDVQHVVQVSTNIETGCEHCHEPIGGEGLAASINHFLTQHSYRLLHVGPETSRDMNGNLWHSTVAILGK